MRVHEPGPIVDFLLDHIDRRASWQTRSVQVPTAIYADPDHLAAEHRTLFAAHPQAVALGPDLPEPRSHLAVDHAGMPIVVTRDEDGDVHAFANVCAHRGSQVASDRGCGRRLTCPYHAWSYDHAGTLVAVPDAGAFPEVLAPGPGLTPLPAVEANGVIWVTPAVDGPRPTPQLGDLAVDLDRFDIAAHHHWRRHRFELDLNWKLVIDTFLEGYHFASLHRTTVGPLFIANLCHAETAGPHLREILPRKTIEELRDLPRDQWDLIPHTAIVYVLFPNTVFVMQLDHIETWRVQPHPTDPGRCTTDLDFYLPTRPEDAPDPEGAARHWEKNWKLTIDTVIQEDFAAMAGVQRGMAAGTLAATTLGANEPALGMFHQSLAEAMGYELRSSGTVPS